MPNNEHAHQQLLADIQQIKTTEKHQLFLQLLHKKCYSLALLIGCMYCKPEDHILTQLLITLLRYQESLAIDLSITTADYTLRDLAIANQNYSIQFYLHKVGVAVQPQIEAQWTQTITTIDEAIYQNLTPKFAREMQSLEQRINALPLKSSFTTDSENARYDAQRLICILKHLAHLRTYYHDLHDPSMVSQPLTGLATELLYLQRIKTVRDYVNRIAFVVNNLSGEFRAKYDAYLEPISWLILEQLGGICKNPVSLANAVFILPTENSSTHTLATFINSKTERALLSEFIDREELIEELIPHLLSDIADLEILFKNIFTLYLANPVKKEPVLQKTTANLPNIRAAVRYFLENQYLLELLNITSYIDARLWPTPVSNPLKPMTYWNLGTNDQYRKNAADMQTKCAQHALLRRLQKIGELVTAKKTDFSDLDDSIDFKALITVRDLICHQDELNNKYLIDRLLHDTGTLEQIAFDEFYSVYSRLFNFINLRQQTLGVYRFGNAQQHIARVLACEKTRLNQSQSAQKPAALAVALPERRISVESEQLFCAAFDQCINQNLISCADAAEFKNKFLGIFNGSMSIPNRQTQGREFLQPFSLLKNSPHSAIHTQITTIFNSAVKKTQTTVEQRQQKRDHVNAEANKRKQEKEAKFSGLDNLRALAKEFAVAVQAEHLMTPLKLVDAALEMLGNLQQFLEQYGYLDPTQKFTTLNQWDQYNLNTLSLAQLMRKNPNLNEALEYNLAQLLQYLHKIKDYTEAQDCTYLNKKYELLRSLRNVLEHGNNTRAVHDEPVDFIPSCIIAVIYKLQPELRQIKQKMTPAVPNENAPPTAKPESSLVALSIFVSQATPTQNAQAAGLEFNIDPPHPQ